MKVYARELGDKERAAATLEQLLDTDPSYEPAFDELEDLYRQMRQWVPLVWTIERHAARLHNAHARADKLLELGELAAGPLGEPALAIDAYERVRALRPKDATALAALASLQTTTGDVARAAEALEALAEGQSDPKSKADYQVKAGEVLLLRGQTSRSLDLFQQALEAWPGHGQAASKLHAALLANQDVDAAIGVMERAILESRDGLTKARLSAELAETRWQQRHDAPRAHAAATMAIEHEPDNVPARLLLAELDQSRGDLEGALRRYETIVGHAGELDSRRAIRLLGGLAQARAELGDTKGALRAVDLLLEKQGRERAALFTAARISFLVEDHPRAVELASSMVHRYGKSLSASELATCLYWRGESLRRMGHFDEAVEPLQRAAVVNPTALEPLRALADVFRAQRRLVQVSETLLRILDRVQGDAKVDMLLEIGSLAENELEDRTTAAKTYLAALALRPGDRRILLNLARLYSAERDWAHLIDAILRLVQLVDSGPEKAKYLQTAARVAVEEMQDIEKADELFVQALGFDGSSMELVLEAIETKTRLNDMEGVRDLLRVQLDKALERGDSKHAFGIARKLVDVHLSWNWYDEAIAVIERTLAEAGREHELEDTLLGLYARDPIRFLDRATVLTSDMLRSAPHLPGPYRILRRMYAAAKRQDATWLTCQALTVLGSAEPDESIFYRRQPAQWLRSAEHAHHAARVLRADRTSLCRPCVGSRRSAGRTELDRRERTMRSGVGLRRRRAIGSRNEPDGIGARDSRRSKVAGSDATPALRESPCRGACHDGSGRQAHPFAFLGSGPD